MSEIQIKVDGQEKTWPRDVITPKEILELGEVREPYSDYIILKIHRGTEQEVWDGEEEELHKSIKIEQESAFSIKHKKPGSVEIHYTVNGESQVVSGINNKLTAQQILEKANFVPSDKFKLFNVKTQKDYTDPNQEIIIQNKDEFLALSSGPTPVA